MSRRPRVEEVDDDEPLRPRRRPRVDEPDENGNYPRRDNRTPYERVRDGYRKGAEIALTVGTPIVVVSAGVQGAITGAKWIKGQVQSKAPEVAKWLEDRWEDVKKWAKNLRHSEGGSITVVDAKTSAITDGSSATIPAVMI